jgi:AmiR/NasT family two-component response regulator
VAAGLSCCHNPRALTGDGYTVLLANEDRDELEGLASLVEGAGHEVCALAISSAEAGDAIIEHRPSMAMILVEGDHEHALQLMVEIGSFADIPLVMLAREISDEILQAASEQDVVLLHLPGRPETVGQVISMAAERHQERRKLEKRVGEIDGILERRSTIEQAKGILMERHGIDAAEAFTQLRNHARSNQLRVVDVAASIITARDLLTNGAVDAHEGP